MPHRYTHVPLEEPLVDGGDFEGFDQLPRADSSFRGFTPLALVAHVVPEDLSDETTID